MAKASAVKWVLATAGGAIVGALAIRALDKYVLSKDKEDEPKQLPEQVQSPMGSYGIPGYQSPIMPVFLPIPSMYPLPAPPMPPMLSQLGRRAAPEEEEEEEDAVDAVMKEWDFD